MGRKLNKNALKIKNAFFLSFFQVQNVFLFVFLFGIIFVWTNCVGFQYVGSGFETSFLYSLEVLKG